MATRWKISLHWHGQYSPVAKLRSNLLILRDMCACQLMTTRSWIEFWPSNRNTYAMVRESPVQDAANRLARSISQANRQRVSGPSRP
jgi:hypothetical protein